MRPDDGENHETGITIEVFNLAVKEYIRRQTAPINERIMELQKKLKLAGDSHTYTKICDQIEELRKKIADLPKNVQPILEPGVSRKKWLQLLDR
jgi:hypothetical protein